MRVTKILRNTWYIGKAYQFRYDTTDGTKVLRPIEEQILLPEGVVPAIIDDETFQAAQQQLEINKQEAARKNPHPEAYLLRSGFLICGYCGGHLFGRGFDPYISKKDMLDPEAARLRKARYGCGKRIRNKEACPGVTINVSIIDVAVWEVVGEIIKDFSLVQEAMEAVKKQYNGQADLKAIKNSLATALETQKNLVEDLTNPLIRGTARTLVIEELGKLEKHIEKLHADLYEVEKDQKDWLVMEAEREAFIKWCLEYKDTYPKADYKEKRRALRQLGIVAVVYRESDPNHERYEIRVQVPRIASVIGKCWSRSGRKS